MSTCPACQQGASTDFYEALRVPTTSNLLMASRDDALRWPRGDVRLALCDRCGFIWNRAFDPATQAPSATYEATQACSPTFGRFARSLAQAWIDRHRLHGKRIIEVGSGREGEFLKLLCDLAGATGVGIDPIADPAAGNKRVRFIAEPLSPRHLQPPPDFLVCRHTLEHVAEVSAFLRLTAGTLARHGQTVVAIEVPDTLRVLRENAFWDVYYEHCSYFTPGSLARALHAAGFELMRHELMYDGQYLVAECRAGPHTSLTLAAVDTPRDVQEATARFAARVAEELSRWRATLADGRSTVLWGAGSKAVGFLTTLGDAAHVNAVVDINPGKQGTFLPGGGQEIVAPERLRELRPERVIVMNAIYLPEIKAQLESMGLRPELLTL